MSAKDAGCYNALHGEIPPGRRWTRDGPMLDVFKDRIDQSKDGADLVAVVRTCHLDQFRLVKGSDGALYENRVAIPASHVELFYGRN